MDLFGGIVVLVLSMLASVIFVGASDNKCTVVKAKTLTKFEQVYKPCKMSYRARCSWFSLDYCTFYHEQYCNKNFNTSETVYVKVIECCATYVMAPNGTCVVKSKVENDDWYIMQQNATTVAPVHFNPIDTGPARDHQNGDPNNDFFVDPSKITKVETKENSMALSHGAYAGIGCALLFLSIIGVLTFIGVRKRRRRFAPRKSSRSEQRVPIHSDTEDHMET